MYTNFTSLYIIYLGSKTIITVFALAAVEILWMKIYIFVLILIKILERKKNRTFTSENSRVCMK